MPSRSSSATAAGAAPSNNNSSASGVLSRLPLRPLFTSQTAPLGRACKVCSMGSTSKKRARRIPARCVDSCPPRRRGIMYNVLMNGRLSCARDGRVQSTWCTRTKGMGVPVGCQPTSRKGRWEGQWWRTRRHTLVKLSSFTVIAVQLRAAACSAFRVDWQVPGPCRMPHVRPRDSSMVNPQS